MIINGGDYLVEQFLNLGFAVDFDLDGSAKTTTKAQGARDANHTIYVQRIVLSYNAHAAGKVFTVQDTAASPVVIANRSDLAAAAGVPDVVVWDFGPKGTPLTQGKDLNYVANTGGTGFTGRVHMEGYQRLTAVIASNVAS